MSARRTGPVRSEEASTAVLDAAARLFVERGYDHLTMEAIASEAQVGKATLYRWWRSKGEVIAECLLSGRLSQERLALPNTGDLRADLKGWLARIFEVAASAQGEALLCSLIAAAAENADVGRRLRDSLSGGSSVVERLIAAERAGQLPQGTALDELAEALVGAVLIRVLSRQPVDERAVERLVDALVRS